MTAAVLMKRIAGVPALLIVLALGLAMGLVNGALIVLTRGPDIVVTLAMLFVWEGVALPILETPGGAVADWLRGATRGAIGPVPLALAVMAALIAAVWWPIRRSRLGLSIYATGSDERAAFRFGEAVGRTRIVDDRRALLADPGIDVIDIALPPEHRAPVIEAALRAGKPGVRRRRDARRARYRLRGRHRGQRDGRGPRPSPPAGDAGHARGHRAPVLEGQWFNDGFRGTMGALLCAIEDGHEPANGARENLRAPALTFAAVESRRTGREVAVGRGVGWPAEATTARRGGTGRGSAGGRMLQMAAPPAGPGCPQAPEQLACPDDMLALHRPRRRGSAAP